MKVNLNLEQGDSVSRWGRLIFHVADVVAFWTHLKKEGFDAEIPIDASWGERHFHMPSISWKVRRSENARLRIGRLISNGFPKLDPDGHELSFAQPLQ